MTSSSSVRSTRLPQILYKAHYNEGRFMPIGAAIATPEIDSGFDLVRVARRSKARPSTVYANTKAKD